MTEPRPVPADDAGTRPRVARSAREIAQASLRLHAALVAEGLEQWDD